MEINKDTSIEDIKRYIANLEYTINSDSPEYIRNNYDLIKSSIDNNQPYVIDHVGEDVLNLYPDLIEKAILKGYIINPNSPNCIKDDQYLIYFLEKRGYCIGDKIISYVVSCLKDVNLLHTPFLNKYINYATEKQITPKVLESFFSFHSFINKIEKQLWDIIINNRKLLDVVLKNSKAQDYDTVLTAFFPRNILNSTTEENLDYVLNYISTKCNKDFGNLGLFKYKLQYLNSKSRNFGFYNLNMELLTNDYSFLGIETLNSILNDASIRHRIFQLREQNKLEVLEMILSFYQNISTSKNDLVHLLLENGLNYNYHFYDDLFSDISYLSKISYSKQKEIINNLVIVLINSFMNEYEITRFEELEDKNLLSKREKYYSSKEPSLRMLYFKKKYNLSQPMINQIYNRYLCHLDKQSNIIEQLPDNLRNVLLDIYEVMKKDYTDEEIEEIIDLYNNIELKPLDINYSVFLEGLIRNEYIKTFDEALYRPREEDRLHEFDDLGIPVYEITSEFGMLAHSVHGLILDTYDENVLKDWNRPYIKNHGICTCYITNQNTQIASDNTILMGFYNLENNSILLMAPYDMHSQNNSYASTYEQEDKFYFPNDLINNTRVNRCEVVIERRNLVHGKSYKRQPDYLIYKTMLDDDLTPSCLQDDSLWIKTVEAAKEFNIPIVIISKTKILKYEQKNIDDMMVQIVNNHNYDLIPNIIVRFINNICSRRGYEVSKDILFDMEGLGRLIESIIYLAERLILEKNYVDAKKVLELLELAIDNEQSKISRLSPISYNNLEYYKKKIEDIIYDKIPEDMDLEDKAKAY